MLKSIAPLLRVRMTTTVTGLRGETWSGKSEDSSTAANESMMLNRAHRAVWTFFITLRATQGKVSSHTRSMRGFPGPLLLYGSIIVPDTGRDFGIARVGTLPLQRMEDFTNVAPLIIWSMKIIDDNDAEIARLKQTLGKYKQSNS